MLHSTPLMAEAQTHLCAVALAEDEGFLICPTWDTAEEEQQHDTLQQLTVPGVCKQRGAQHVRNPSTMSSWHSWPKLFLPWQNQDNK